MISGCILRIVGRADELVISRKISLYMLSVVGRTVWLNHKRLVGRLEMLYSTTMTTICLYTAKASYVRVKASAEAGRFTICLKLYL